MQLTKLEAAKRQIDFAIEAFFEDKDIVPVHTVAGAALILAHDLVEEQKPGKSWANLVADANHLSTKRAISIMRVTQNALKHARLDSNGVVEFEPKDTEFLIASALFDLGELNEAGEVHSIPSSVFQLWFIAMHSEIFSHADYNELLSAAKELFPDIALKDRVEQLSAGLSAMRAHENGV